MIEGERGNTGADAQPVIQFRVQLLARGVVGDLHRPLLPRRGLREQIDRFPTGQLLARGGEIVDDDLPRDGIDDEMMRDEEETRAPFRPAICVDRAHQRRVGKIEARVNAVGDRGHCVGGQARIGHMAQIDPRQGQCGCRGGVGLAPRVALARKAQTKRIVVRNDVLQCVEYVRRGWDLEQRSLVEVMRRCQPTLENSD